MALGCKELWTIQLHLLWVPRESSPYKDTLESPMCSYSGMYINPLMTWRTCNESVSTDKEWFADREEVDEIKPSGKSPCLQRCTHYDSNILALLTHKYLRINTENCAAKSSQSGYVCTNLSSSAILQSGLRCGCNTWQPEGESDMLPMHLCITFF